MTELKNIIDQKEYKPCNSEKGVIGFDEVRGWYNLKYPPNYEKYGTKNEGYRTWREEELFYLFCVQGNDMHIRHNGRDYHFLSDPDYSAICDSRYTEIYKKYKNSIELIEDFEIEGRKLVDIVNELDEIEWM